MRPSISYHQKIFFLVNISFVFFVLILTGCTPAEQKVDHPKVGDSEAASSSSFEEVVTTLRKDIESRRAAGVPVPVPADSGGGYTHEQHKQNAKTIYESSMVYQQTDDSTYRDFATDILLDYADLYPTLGLHPKVKPETPSRLFWQGLNEAWWLVYVIQGYEVIRNDISEADRTKIETKLIRPMANFLSEGSPQTFNRIHNHGTWAAAAVGMTGYVLEEAEFVERALYGLDKSGKAGFLRQVELLFSPDGYYTEGPYYQRYALMPFVLFAQAIEKNAPELEIFEYRDGVLQKAILSTIQQSYAGRFFPINDAIREKGLNTAELRYAVAIAYDLMGDPTLLSIAQLQKGVVPTPQGRAVANAVDAGLAEPFVFETLKLDDGPKGDRGALIVLRSGPDADDAAVVFKAASQGLGHGHFDRLGMLYFDNGNEIIADYGAARFLNVEPKNGGRYLPENLSWAKQTIAHNTMVVDQASQFGADWRMAEEYTPTILAFDDTPGASFAAAETRGAYSGVRLQRVLAMVTQDDGHQYVVDIMRGMSAAPHVYDFPVHFKGQLIETSQNFNHATEQLKPMGAANGYQHLWQTAHTQAATPRTVSDLSFLIKDQFYTMTYTSDTPLTSYMTRLGANDPDNNLRHEQAMILRTETDNSTFFSVYERHGRYDNDEEVTVFSGGSVKDLQMKKVGLYDIYSISLKTGGMVHILFSEDPDPIKEHILVRNGDPVSWKGPVGLYKTQHNNTTDVIWEDVR